MIIDEAIKHLDDCMSETEKILYPEVLAAHKLGIEALKQIKWLHESHVLHDDELLPSETKD